MFESLGYAHVVTYINSGNIIFSSSGGDIAHLQNDIQTGIQATFGLIISTLVVPYSVVDVLCSRIPDNWRQDEVMKTDVIFVFEEKYNAWVIWDVVLQEGKEVLLSLPGAVVRYIEYACVAKSKLPKHLMQKTIYPYITIRNINTVRKLHAMMQEILTLQK